MPIVSYDEFVAWCKYWDYTIEEGFRAMCFSANIVGQHFGNCFDYEKKVLHDGCSDALKKIVKKEKDDAILLLSLYNNLERTVYNMLEEHENRKETTQ